MCLIGALNQDWLCITGDGGLRMTKINDNYKELGLPNTVGEYHVQPKITN